jgi:hypothetical protein
MVKILNFQFLSFSEIDDFFWNFELILIIYFSKILIFIRFKKKNRVRNEALKGQLLENPLQVFHSWICLVHKVLQTSMACSVCSNLIGGWKKIRQSTVLMMEFFTLTRSSHLSRIFYDSAHANQTCHRGLQNFVYLIKPIVLSNGTMQIRSYLFQYKLQNFQPETGFGHNKNGQNFLGPPTFGGQ